MSSAERMTGEIAPAASAPTSDLRTTLLRVAWLSILLGLVMECLLVLLAVALAKSPNAKPVLADVVQKVSWSTIVCAGLALGTALKGSGPLRAGVAGFFAAPVAFIVARTLHKAATAALGLADPGGGPDPLLLALIKAVEYAFLGAVVGWLGGRAWGGLGAHAAAGFAAGVVFGGAVLALTVQVAAKPPGMDLLLPRGINEVIFPVGCAVVLFAVENLGKRLPS